MIIAAYKAEGDWRDKLIRKVCSIRHNEPVIYSHLELVTDNVTTSISASKRDGNIVRQKDIEYTNDRWDFYEVPDIWENAETFIGTPYDTLGAILCVTPFAYPSVDQIFCSELMAYCLGWEDAYRFDPHMVVEKLKEGSKQFHI